MISRICEDFSCLPTEAEEELERDPQLVMRVMETRAYRDVFMQIKNAKDESQVPKGPLVDLWAEFEFPDPEDDE